MLAHCPLCERPGADVQHLLSQGPGVGDLNAKWFKDAAREFLAEEAPWHALVEALFEGRCGRNDWSPAHQQARVRYVGSVFQRLARVVSD